MGNDVRTYWLPWACDNDCFKGLNAPQFLRCLAKMKEYAAAPMWVTCPDVVGDHVETLRLWNCWSPVLIELGFIPAFVLQDGCSPSDVPACDVLFVGGTDQYKLGREAANCVRMGKAAGRAVHMGRVNSLKRIAYAWRIGCDSVDGRQWSSFGETYIPWVLDWFEKRTSGQGLLPF